MKATKRNFRAGQYAYKVMESIDESSPVGTLFLDNEWRGKRYTFERYDRDRLVFERYMTVRYLGRVTARTSKGKIRQLLSLPGTAHARRGSAKTRSVPS